MNPDDAKLSRTRARQTSNLLPGRGDVPLLGPDDFVEGFGEKLAQTLDIATWRTGRHLIEEYDRIRAEVEEAVRLETALEKQMRERVLPRIAWLENAPKMAGHHVVWTVSTMSSPWPH